MKRKPGKKAKTVSMMGKPPNANLPWMKKAKKPEADDKPHVKPSPPSANKNTSNSKREKRLKGVML